MVGENGASRPTRATKRAKRQAVPTEAARKEPAKLRAARIKVRASKAIAPTLALERQLWADGHGVVVGMDEVGRGAWAGPLMVGAAVLPRDRRVYKVRDSKMLLEGERERLFDRLADWCVAWAVGSASQIECDELGMSEAQRLAARRAIEGLGLTPDRVLVDGKWDFVGTGRTIRIVKGDATCLSISTASILAKVTRDRAMRAEAPNFPAYDFDLNKGYPCPRHKMALQAFGPTSIHRRTWVFMDHLPWIGMRVFRPGQPTLFDLPDAEAADAEAADAEAAGVDPAGAACPADW